MLRSMNILEKLDVIKSLDTKGLIDTIRTAEFDLEQALREELQFRSEQVDYIAGKSADCNAVKAIEAELNAQAPASADGKKMTVDEKKAWLERQRKENKDFADAITKQRMADFTAGDFTIKIEMLRIKLNDLRGLLALRTSQITFFSGDVRTTLPLEDELIEGGN